MKKAFVAALLFWPLMLQAAPCWKTIFEWNEKNLSRKYKLLILPFENGSRLDQDDWIRLLFPVILQDYLAAGKEILPVIAVSAPSSALFDTASALEIGRKAGVDFLVMGQFAREGPILHISTRLLDVQKGNEAGRVNGDVEFPGTRRINDFLIELALQTSRAFKKDRLTKKKLFPIRIETSSASTLRAYVLGTIALKKGTVEGLTEAVRYFEESIKNDYNYSPAYLGLSVALSRRGFVESLQGLSHRESFARSRAELEKARLLRAATVEHRGRETEVYLEAETHHRLAEGYAAQGKTGKAIREMNKAIRLLPGDLASRKRLVDYLKAEGRPREAQKEEATIAQLDGCGV